MEKVSLTTCQCPEDRILVLSKVKGSHMKGRGEGLDQRRALGGSWLSREQVKVKVKVSPFTSLAV